MMNTRTEKHRVTGTTVNSNPQGSMRVSNPRITPGAGHKEETQSDWNPSGIQIHEVPGDTQTHVSSLVMMLMYPRVGFELMRHLVGFEPMLVSTGDDGSQPHLPREDGVSPHSLHSSEQYHTSFSPLGILELRSLRPLPTWRGPGVCSWELDRFVGD